MGHWLWLEKYVESWNNHENRQGPGKYREEPEAQRLTNCDRSATCVILGNTVAAFAALFCKSFRGSRGRLHRTESMEP